MESLRAVTRVALLVLVAALGWPAAASAADGSACTSAIAAAERDLPLPPAVLRAIAVVETGRPMGGRVVPWPWSVNAEGVAYYYTSKVEAVAGVQSLRAAGLQSIDVGCMQVNLAAHPRAFPSLDDAFDPATNVAYAARFFLSLYRQTGRWPTAMTAYHSQTPALAADYARRLLAVWPDAASYGLTAEGDASRPVRPGRPAKHGPRENADSGSRILLAALPIHGQAWPTRQP